MLELAFGAVSPAPSAPESCQGTPVSREFQVTSGSVHWLRTRRRSNIESARFCGTITTVIVKVTELIVAPGGIWERSKPRKARRISRFTLSPRQPATRFRLPPSLKSGENSRIYESAEGARLMTAARPKSGAMPAKAALKANHFKYLPTTTRIKSFQPAAHGHFITIIAKTPWAV